MAIRAVIYARVSSVAQRDAHTIESQLRVLPEFVRGRGWQLVGTYVDDGHTAKAGHLEKRTDFTRLLRDAAAGAFDVVVVIDFDRLTRSEDLGERGNILQAFQRAGVQLAIASSGQMLDLRTSSGDLFAQLAAFFSAEENRKRRERAIRGRAESVRRGHNPASTAPYGLRFSKAEGWTVEESEAAVVREIYQRLAAGESGPKIGADLQARGIATPRGGRWCSAVRNLASRPTYRGVFQVAGPDGPTVAVPRIVEDALWYAARETMAANRRNGLDRTKHEYLISRFARCARCGGEIWAATPRVSKPGYYFCVRRRYPGPGEAPCDAPWRTVKDVDARVWARVCEVVTRPDLVEAMLARRGDRLGEAASWQSDVTAARARLGRLEEAQAAILARFRRGLIPESVMDAELAAAAREREFLQRQVEVASGQAQAVDRVEASLEQVVGQLAALRARLPSAPFAQRRQLVTTLCAAVLVDGDRVVLDVVLGEAEGASGRRNGRSSGEGDLAPSQQVEVVRFRVVA